MKKTILFTFMVCYFVACKSPYQTVSVNYLNGNGNTIALRCSGFGNNRLKTIADAEKNAIEEILFRGIPGHSQKDPLVSVTEEEAKKNHQKYFKELLEEGRYKSFIISSIPTGEVQKVKGGKGNKTITVDVTVNLRALRSDLEQQGIIRKFGF